jgi:hypothetical protein
LPFSSATEMPEAEARRLLGQNEEDPEDYLDLPIVAPPFLYRQNGQPNCNPQFANCKPPQWPPARPGQHGRTSLIRLFRPIRSLPYPATARAALTLGLLSFMFGLIFWTKTPLSTLTPEPEHGPEIQTAEPAPGRRVENPIFKVSSALFRAKNNIDTFFFVGSAGI